MKTDIHYVEVYIVMKGFYNISFTGAVADAVIVLCESNGIRWTRNGNWTTVFGAGRELVDLIMAKAAGYRTF